MTITDVRVRKISSNGKLKAVASITLDNEFVVHDIKIIEGDKGPFISMPSRKMSEDDFRDIAHPIKPETREYVQDIILRAYKEYMGVERESVS